VQGTKARPGPQGTLVVPPTGSRGKKAGRSDSSHPTEEPPIFDEADLIHRYTRVEAIRDGVLIDVSAVAREAGIRYPVALTRAVWEPLASIILSRSPPVPSLRS
jgi:hypothetical protein